MSGEEFWDIYSNSTNSTLDIYDEAMAFFSEDLPLNFEEDYDVVEIILEIKGHHEQSKEIEKAINFARLIKEKQPHLFDEVSYYLNKLLLNYHCYFDTINEINSIVEFEFEHLLNDIDSFLLNFKRIMLYQHIDILQKNIKKALKDNEIKNKLHNYVKYHLVLLVLFDVLEKQYVKNKDAYRFEKEELLFQLKDCDIIELEETISFFERGFFENIDVSSMKLLVEDKNEEAMHILQAQFCKEMLQKKLKFATSARIWELLMNYWKGNNTTTTNFFAINKITFEEELNTVLGDFFNDNQCDKITLLWGAVYIYDFLLGTQLIDKEEHTLCISVLYELKGFFIVNSFLKLWEYNFIHKWEKPDGVSEIEFIQESKIFEKSFLFKSRHYSDFKIEIKDELEAIGVFSKYIELGEELLKKKKATIDERLSFFEDNFLMHNAKPIIKEANEKIGRNDTCYCGSGKKYKKCCINK
jgi:hypothetical protein